MCIRDRLSEPAELSDAIIIGDTLYAPDYSNPILHTVDLINETAIDFDFSANFTYGPKPSLKISNVHVNTTHRQLMLVGEYYAGHAFRVIDINRGELYKTLDSTGGGSPRPLAGLPAVFTDEKIFPACNGGVAGVSNDIYFYDEHFNLLGTCDLASITDYADPIYGFSILARLTDGRYFAIGAIMRHESTTLKIGHLCWIFLKSDFSYDSHYVIWEAPADTINIWLANACREGGNQTELPIIDLNNYKAYIHAMRHGSVHRLYEIDFSDLSIDEINSMAYLVYL